ncbi:YbgC/FadM family acyl-CoA thioesterase [Sphingomonas aracearum]|uniref:Thioesterase n=1 Tax=Sphingomonas aracearum TaxID=2283317 RepID=A0A369VR53_9SPHN|nr:YbgC/FadM family acyl-CoA thioesterase [Sphingomonas aracearum]RDE04145.1 thioesterase [Sphingomonas aracearum]
MIEQSGTDVIAASGRFDGKIHDFPVRVYFEDTDLSGVVYHANYLRYPDRARADMLELAGIEHAASARLGDAAYAVISADLRYHSPARLNDLLVVSSTLIGLRRVDVRVAHRIRRGDVTLFTAEVTLALLSSSGRPVRHPAD